MTLKRFTRTRACVRAIERRYDVFVPTFSAGLATTLDIGSAQALEMPYDPTDPWGSDAKAQARDVATTAQDIRDAMLLIG